MDQAYLYTTANGIDSEASYPYVGIQQTCAYNSSSRVIKSSGYTTVTPKGSESALQTALATKGPISVAVNGTQLQFYSSGILNNSPCAPGTTMLNLNHAVLAVGYGVHSPTGLQYWSIKNSWGSGWGEAGFARIQRNSNQQICTATLPSYPS